MRAEIAAVGSAPSFGGDAAWSLVLGLRKCIAELAHLQAPVGVCLDDDGTARLTEVGEGAVVLTPDTPGGWRAGTATVDPDGAQVLNLYVPLCIGEHAATLVVGHLAQTIDGRVATRNGDSQFISGQADLVHTHRLRALFDAVIVGACTIELDDPRLTTRLVAGDNPTRVVLDGRGRLTADHRIFADGTAPTVLVRGTQCPPIAPGPATEVVTVDTVDDWLPIPAVVKTLAARGLRRLFVEGGGVTVSRFIGAKAMDRLHLTVAPVLFGSGRPAVVLPEIESLDQAITVQCRHIPLGSDMLFDCPLSR